MTIKIGDIVKVKFGPTVWVDKNGAILKLDKEHALVLLPSQDDAGKADFEVWMPLSFLEDKDGRAAEV